MRRLSASLSVGLEARIKDRQSRRQEHAHHPESDASRSGKDSSALPKDAIKVIMDERGADPTSTKLAQQINRWGDQGRPIAFIIGGADGIDPGLKAEADFTLRLSSLTLPHAMARVLLLEQIYRSWSLLHNHPYHRA